MTTRGRARAQASTGAHFLTTFPPRPPGLYLLLAALRVLHALAALSSARLSPATRPAPPPAARHPKSRAAPRAKARPPVPAASAPPTLSTSPPATSGTAGGTSLRALNRAVARVAWHGPVAVPPAKLAASGLHLGSLKHADGVACLAWAPAAPASTRLATGAADRAVRLFAVPPGVGAGARLAANPPARRDVGAELVGLAYAGAAGAASTPDPPLVVLTRGGPLGAPGLVAYGAAASPAWALPPSTSFLGGHRALAVRGGGGILAVASEKTHLEIFSAGAPSPPYSTPTRLAALDTAGIRTHDLAVSGDGAWAAAATFAPGVKVYAILRDRAGTPQAVVRGPDLTGHAGQVLAVTLSGDGGTAATSCRDGQLAAWALTRWTKHDRPGTGPPARLLFRVPAPTPGGAPYRRLALDPAGRVLAAATDGGALHFLDAVTGDLLAAVDPAHGGGVTGLEWRPTGGGGGGAASGAKAVLASAGEDRMVHLWASPVG